MSFGDLLVVGATWALCLAAVWAALIVAAAVVEVASSGRLALMARLGCPAPARRALLAGLGVVLATGGAVVTGPVSAAPAPFGQGSSGQGRDQLGLPVPARPTGSAYPPPRQQVEVRPGDSLWRLSQQRSSARASTQEVARLVERTYRANRRVIGLDPDLIHPGQRLRIPTQRRHTPPHLETP
jgi:nucleoid-associated protein YgaU